jgi:hypothetical protein
MEMWYFSVARRVTSVLAIVTPEEGLESSKQKEHEEKQKRGPKDTAKSEKSKKKNAWSTWGMEGGMEGKDERLK